jgi:hypothetical protein
MNPAISKNFVITGHCRPGSNLDTGAQAQGNSRLRPGLTAEGAAADPPGSDLNRPYPPGDDDREGHGFRLPRNRRRRAPFR